MKIEEILQIWREDAKIDDLNIDMVASNIPQLHAKYIEILSNERSLFRSHQIKRKETIRILRDYYMGVSTQEDLTQLNRLPYGERILKNEVFVFIESDELMRIIDARISIQEEKVDVLFEIVKSINNRNFTLKSIIDWRKFTSGG